jgi:hypothetical protein
MIHLTGSALPSARVELQNPAFRAYLAGFLLGLLFNAEDGANTFLWNVDGSLLEYKASLPRRQYSS